MIIAFYVEILANALAINVVDHVQRDSSVYVVKVCLILFYHISNKVIFESFELLGVSDKLNYNVSFIILKY